MLKTPLLLRLFVVLKTHLSTYHLVSLYTRHRLSAKLRILHTTSWIPEGKLIWVEFSIGLINWGQLIGVN